MSSTARVVCGFITAGVVLLPGFSLSADAQSRPPTVAVSPTGSDTTCVRGDLTRPCQTFDRAYQLASCGDVVSIRSGSYAEQILRERAACSSPITLNAEQGAVTQRVWFGTCQGCYSADAPDDLVLRGLKTAGVIMWGDVEDVTLDRIDGGSFFIRGGVRITVRGSDWGPCPSPASGSSANQCLGYFGPQQSRISYQSNPSDTSNLLIEGNTFHDHPAVSPDHWECLWTNGATNVTFRGNRIYNCENTAAIWLEGGTQTSLAGTWVFENNWFGPNASAIGVAQLPLQNGQVIIRYNGFAQGAGVLYHGSGSDTGTVRIVGNVLGTNWCVTGARYTSNLVVAGRKCDETDKQSIFGYRYDNERLRPASGAANAVRVAFATVAIEPRRSLRASSRVLVGQRALPPPGGWSAKTLRAIVADPIYLGRRMGIQANHPALVSSSRWRQVQRALASQR